MTFLSISAQLALASVFVFSFQMVLCLSQVSLALSLFVPLPSHSPVHPIRTGPISGMGKWLMNKKPKVTSIRKQSRTLRTKEEKHISFHCHLRGRFRCFWFRGIEADKLLRAQWGTYNLLGEWGMKGTGEQCHCPSVAALEAWTAWTALAVDC